MIHKYVQNKKVRPWRHAVLRSSKKAIRLQIEMLNLCEINGKGVGRIIYGDVKSVIDAISCRIVKMLSMWRYHQGIIAAPWLAMAWVYISRSFGKSKPSVARSRVHSFLSFFILLFFLYFALVDRLYLVLFWPKAQRLICGSWPTGSSARGIAVVRKFAAHSILAWSLAVVAGSSRIVPVRYT